MQIRNAALAVLTSVLVVAGCDPTPHFPPAGPPPPGRIRSEAEVVARADEPTTVNLDYDVKLSVPAGALPEGTRMTARLLVSLGVDAGLTLLDGPAVWENFGQQAALQILPESLVLMKPATLTVVSFPVPIEKERYCPVVRFAHAEDTEWQIVGRATVGVSAYPGVADLFASVDRSGLWSLAYVHECSNLDGGVDAQRD